MNCPFYMIMCQDTSEPIYFKIGIMLNTTKLYSLNDLNVHSRSQGYEKSRTCTVILLQNVYEAPQMLAEVDYVKEMTVKKFCKFGKCRSLEQLLFLL